MSHGEMTVRSQNRMLDLMFSKHEQQGSRYTATESEWRDLFGCSEGGMRTILHELLADRLVDVFGATATDGCSVMWSISYLGIRQVLLFRALEGK